MSRRSYVIDFIAQIIKTAPSKASAQTAEIIVERLTEEGLLALGYGNADIDRVLDSFKEVFGTTKVSKYDRWAAKRLCDKYGPQAVTGIIQLLATHNQERFAPVVGSVAELENKWVSVMNFLRKLGTGNEIIDA